MRSDLETETRFRSPRREGRAWFVRLGGVIALLTAGLVSAGCARPSGLASPAAAGPEDSGAAALRLQELAKAYRAAGDLTRAEQYLNAAVDAGADQRQVFPLLIQVCTDDGRYHSAVAYAEDFLKRYPAEHRLRFLLGTLYAALGDIAAAKRTLEQVVLRAPRAAGPHYALAVLLRDEFSDFAGADSQFREYLRVAPHGEHQQEAEESLLVSVE